MFIASARNAKGYATWSSPDSRLVEKDTLQCVHCGGHWFVEPGSGIKRGWCTRCGGPHCGSQPCWTCVPLEQFVEQVERAVARQQLFQVL